MPRYNDAFVDADCGLAWGVEFRARPENLSAIRCMNMLRSCGLAATDRAATGRAAIARQGDARWRRTVSPSCRPPDSGAARHATDHERAVQFAADALGFTGEAFRIDALEQDGFVDEYLAEF